MDQTRTTDNAAAQVAAQSKLAELPIDLLRRVFVPIEKRNVLGHWTFRTMDGKRYARDEHGAIHAAKKTARTKKERRALRSKNAHD